MTARIHCGSGFTLLALGWSLSCNALCQSSCADDYATCQGARGDPLLLDHCRISYEACVDSCPSDDPDRPSSEDAGTPADASGAGLERN